MQIPLEIIRKLLKGEHVNVEERRQHGAPVTATLQYDEVLNELKKMIGESEWFPFVPAKKNEYEGLLIQKKGEQYLCYSQRMNALDPDQVAEKSEKTFDSLEEVANYYLKWALHLPGNLDGYTVVK